MTNQRWLRGLMLGGALPGLVLLLGAGACGEDQGTRAPDQGTVRDAGADSSDMGPRRDGTRPDRQVTSPDAAPRPDSTVHGLCTLNPGALLKAVPGTTSYGRNNYIEYEAGGLPIIISAPHGGSLKPGEIKNRTYGVLGGDSHSQEVAFETAAYLKRLTGRRPHLIINRLHRIKLDANRDVKEACQGDPHSEQAWREYHTFIERARKWVATRCGQGLYLDFHTNGHPARWVELGYLLRSSELALPDSLLNGPTYVKKSSVRHLAGLPGKLLADIVRGPTSMGGLLSSQGVKAVPSPLHPDPAGGGYFNGGYNTARHGSRGGGTIDGLQVETHYSIMDTTSERDAYARKLARAIKSFVELSYGFTLRDATYKAPVHAFCAQARPLTLTGGQVTVTESTEGAHNEFGTQVTCGNSPALDGPQLYYRVKLTGGTRYRFTFHPDFPARAYLFGDTCAPKSMASQCTTMGMPAPLTLLNTTRVQTLSPRTTGFYHLAVDSVAAHWVGTFTFTLRALP